MDLEGGEEKGREGGEEAGWEDVLASAAAAAALPAPARLCLFLLGSRLLSLLSSRRFGLVLISRSLSLISHRFLFSSLLILKNTRFYGFTFFIVFMYK